MKIQDSNSDAAARNDRRQINEQSREGTRLSLALDARSCSRALLVRFLQFVVTLAMLQLLLQPQSYAKASARVNSDAWAWRPKLFEGEAEHSRWTPADWESALQAEIEWTSGNYKLLGTKKLTCGQRVWAERKFGEDRLGYPAPRTFDGFKTVCEWPGDNSRGSLVYGLGRGKSEVDDTKLWPYEADWYVEAGGRLADKKTNYEGYVAGDDPWPILPSELASPDTLIDLFIPIGIEGGSFGNQFRGQSYVGFDVSYDTADHASDLLHITLSDEGVHVTTGAIDSSRVELYSMTYSPIDGLSAPSTLPSQLLSASALKSMLEQDLQPGQEPETSVLERPIYIGVVVRSVRVPALRLSDGGVADISVSSFAYDSSEPTNPTQ